MTAESYKQRGSTFRNPGRTVFYFRILVILAILATIAFWLDYWIRGELGIAEKFLVYTRGEWGWGVLIGGGIIYILLLSLPFVPGVELGILLMCVFGKEGVIFVYGATVAGLSLAFLFGRLIPRRWIDWLFSKRVRRTRLHPQRLKHRRALGFPASGRESKPPALRVAVDSALERQQNARSCLDRSDELGKMADCISSEHTHIPSWLKSFVLKYRYVTIAILVNLPGNYILGGGGGISIACGASRYISWGGFLLTIVLAVSPVPIFVYLGIIQLEAFLGV